MTGAAAGYTEHADQIPSDRANFKKVASGSQVPFHHHHLPLCLDFHCLPLAFHCLFTAYSLLFHCLPLTFHCLPWTFHYLPLTFHCLSLTFHRPFSPGGVRGRVRRRQIMPRVHPRGCTHLWRLLAVRNGPAPVSSVPQLPMVLCPAGASLSANSDGLL